MKKNLSALIAAVAAWTLVASFDAEITFGAEAAPRAAASAPPAPGEEMYEAGANEKVRAPAPAPNRRPDEGAGPYKRLVIRGATLIDGTGAPPIGPVDIVIENDRIVRVASVGFPKVPISDKGRPAKGEHEIDATGMYVLPGFINAHAHIADSHQGLVGTVPPAEYCTNSGSGTGSPRCERQAPSTGCAGR
jgi:hypothetical protein